MNRAKIWKLLRIPIRILTLLTLALFLIYLCVAQPTVSRGTPAPFTTNPTTLRNHVVALSETYYPRDFAHSANLDLCAAYISNSFAQAGARVHLQEYTVQETRVQNVIADLGPDTPQRIVVGAHYDSCYNTPGADDNASGVAGLLELAVLLGKTNLPIHVELVAYTLEEPPFFRSRDMGSARHAQQLREQNADVLGVIVLEMIGVFKTAKRSQPYPIPMLYLFYPSRGDFISVIGRLSQPGFVRSVKSGMKGATDLPVYSINAPPWLPGIDLSDHRNYWNDYPSVMITDTAFFRNPRYHTLQDTADTLDYPRMAKVVESLYSSIVLLTSSSAPRKTTTP